MSQWLDDTVGHVFNVPTFSGHVENVPHGLMP